MTPKSHLRIAPEASLPGEEWVGGSFFAFRLTPYMSGSHGTKLLKRTLLLACMHGRSFSSLCFQAEESEKERNESLVSLTWNIHEAVHIHPPALSPLSSAL